MATATTRARTSGCSRSSPIPAGNPEGIAFDQRSRAFFVSSTGDGAIYRGTLAATPSPFIPARAGQSAVGLKVRHGKLYVAGGSTGAIKVYDLASKALLATFDTGSGGFLNDLVVTRAATSTSPTRSGRRCGTSPPTR